MSKDINEFEPYDKSRGNYDGYGVISSAFHHTTKMYMKIHKPQASEDRNQSAWFIKGISEPEKMFKEVCGGELLRLYLGNHFPKVRPIDFSGNTEFNDQFVITKFGIASKAVKGFQDARNSMRSLSFHPTLISTLLVSLLLGGSDFNSGNIAKDEDGKYVKIDNEYFFSQYTELTSSDIMNLPNKPENYTTQNWNICTRIPGSEEVAAAKEILLYTLFKILVIPDSIIHAILKVAIESTCDVVNTYLETAINPSEVIENTRVYLEQRRSRLSRIVLDFPDLHSKWCKGLCDEYLQQVTEELVDFIKVNRHYGLSEKLGQGDISILLQNEHDIFKESLSKFRIKSKPDPNYSKEILFTEFRSTGMRQSPTQIVTFCANSISKYYSSIQTFYARNTCIKSDNIYRAMRRLEIAEYEGLQFDTVAEALQYQFGDEPSLLDAITMQRGLFRSNMTSQMILSCLDSTYIDDFLNKLKTLVQKYKDKGKYWGNESKSNNISEAMDRLRSAMKSGKTFQTLFDAANYQHEGNCSITEAISAGRMLSESYALEDVAIHTAEKRVQ